jgi:hypothetical protein
MDLPRTIPTSFVPQPASTAARRFHSDFTGAFSFLAYAVLGIIFALAIGVFFYGRILSATKASKDAQLIQAEATIDPATVRGFVQLRNRLSSGAKLLDNHVAFSNFFALIETLLPTPVRFNSVHLTVTGANTSAKKIGLEGTGVAKSFNALAAASGAFATEGRIKDAIFSNIVVNRDNSVSFVLSASLDPTLVAFAPPSAPASAASSSAPLP